MRLPQLAKTHCPVAQVGTWSALRPFPGAGSEPAAPPAHDTTSTLEELQTLVDAFASGHPARCGSSAPSRTSSSNYSRNPRRNWPRNSPA